MTEDLSHMMIEIRNLVPRVAAEAAEAVEARKAQREVELRLLEELVELVKPLSAISNRILSGGDNRYFPDIPSGVLVGGSQPEPNPREGYLCMSRFLLTDGRFMEVHYHVVIRASGPAWDSEYAILSNEDMLKRISVEFLAKALLVPLQQQIAGKRTKTTAATKARTEKLNAICTLLKSRGR